MTQEQKAKKYDEALEWMRELYPGLHGATKKDAEHYFPELKESEDERVRKELIELISCMHDADPRKKGWLDWLEKQKEQKPGAKLTGWVARDKDTEMLNFYMDRPPRRYDFWAAPASLHLPDKGFPDLKWEDEPMEVEMIITKK